jgi:hypothetical protein
VVVTGPGPGTAPNTPTDPESGAPGPDSGEIVPDEGISATHLTPEQVQGLVERSGGYGPADGIARRSR